MTIKQLDDIFNPKTIAVVGASNDKDTVGYGVFRNLRDFKGRVFPVNNKRKKVQGRKAYPSILRIEEEIDLAVIATPAPTVVKLVEECGEKGVKAAVIMSAGFLESGKKGEKMAEDILKLSKKHRMRIMGPNCMGFLRPGKINSSFARKMPAKGNIAFISQSGALGSSILDWALKYEMGFSFFVSLGSMLDISFSDLIDYLGSDPDTGSIVIYMESLNDARKFMSASRSFSRSKPIIVLKAGKSDEGAKAALSHTGSLAGNDEVFDAAFKRAGIVRVNEIDDLFDCAKALSKQKRPRGDKLAIITNAGGPGVISTDMLIHRGGEPASLSQETIKELDKHLNPAWSRRNPVDLLGDAKAKDYKKALEACLKDKGVDGVLILLTPQTMTDPTGIAEAITTVKNQEEKPILASFMGGHDVTRGKEILEKHGIPVFPYPERGVKSFIYLHEYSKNLQSLYQTPSTIPHAFEPDTKENRKIIKEVAGKQRFVLTNEESRKILENYHITVSQSALAKNQEQAVETAKKIGFPVAMKIASPDILHKTEVKGVELNIVDDKQVRKAFEKIMNRVKKNSPKAHIHGVIVEEMIGKKHELIVGSKKDPIFGPAIVFGMGGVAVNVFKDMKVGIPPLNMALAEMLMQETKIYELLKGYRGMSSVDLQEIQFLLYKFAYLISDFPEIKEIDINPYSIDEQGGVVVDAKIILDREYIEKTKNKKMNPYSHLVISPYPKQYIKKIKTKKGKEVLLRPIKPEDEPMEAEMFTHFSDQTQRFRFFGKIKDITHEMLIKYTQIDYDREMAIIAESDSKMLGVVRLISNPYDESAEFAIVVADPYQNQGLGEKMTDYMIEIAKQRGIRKIFAYFLSDNEVMEHIFEKRGFKIIREQKSCRAEKEL
jgi:acetyltransferase